MGSTLQVGKSSLIPIDEALTMVAPTRRILMINREKKIIDNV